jgi:hypothetical protein
MAIASLLGLIVPFTILGAGCHHGRSGRAAALDSPCVWERSSRERAR